MNHTLSAYLPQDRLRALAGGEPLPDRCIGSALMADLSSFTRLTENLRETLGRRYGAEVLTKNLNAVFSALIAEVERYGGSVIDFAGDAIICWFEGPSTFRAAACALALQAAMRPFTALTLPTGLSTPLGLKVSVASGPARRFAIGDPEIRMLDVLAGATLDRMALGEELAASGEILLDAATVQALGTAANITAWRANPTLHERFAILKSLTVKILPLEPAPLPQLEAEILRPWLPRSIYERECSAEGDFMAEFRPCVALFVRFTGIDYDTPAAAPQLDEFLRRLQAIALEYEGALISVTIGDKGSYAYITFGALIAHEDDTPRAVKAALQIRDMARKLSFLHTVQIGVSRGIQYVGVYGGPTRRTFCALGDDVNLAARLMEAAAPGEILVSESVQYAVAHLAAVKPRPPVAVKGKTGLVPIFAVMGMQRRRAIRLQEPIFSLPFVGRQPELQIIDEKLDQALQGQGQVLGIVAEAGLGKSRLAAEAIHIARRKGFTGYGGACQSDGVDSPYMSWKPIWSAFFDVDAEMSPPDVLQALEEKLKDLAPHRLEALPLLGQALDLPAPIPDNTFTGGLDSKTRKNVLHALLEDCLKAAARREAILIVVEDAHWIDELSYDLLADLARATLNFPICMLLAYRPPEQARLNALHMESLPRFTRIALSELTAGECARIVSARLAQLYPEYEDGAPPGLVDKLMAYAQGNPFYLEELLGYLHDSGIDPCNAATLDEIELPDSLHSLILGRLDRLTEQQKMTLRVASIAGRMFHAAWLPGCYPALGDLAQVRTDLEQLDGEGITLRLAEAPGAPDAALTYTFKHAVTREVIYESMPYTRRARLHEQLAGYLEMAQHPAASNLDLLAYHYGRSDNRPKKVEYLRKAGAAAQAIFANQAALDYYTRLLPLLEVPGEQIELHLRWGEVLTLVGEWAQAEEHYQQALALIPHCLEPAEGATSLARCQLALGKLGRLRGDYTAALQWLEAALAAWAALDNPAGLSRAFRETGLVYYRKGDYSAAWLHLEQSLSLAQSMGNKPDTALAIHDLGTVARLRGDYETARRLYTRGLAMQRELGNKQGLANELNNMGLMHHDQGDYAAAQASYEESLALQRELGNKSGIAASLTNLGMIHYKQGDSAAAQALYEESLAQYRQMGSLYGIASTLNNLGLIHYERGQYASAQAFQEESLALRREAGDKGGVATSLANIGIIAYIQSNYSAAQTFFEESLAQSIEIDDKRLKEYALLGLGLAALAQENTTAARPFFVESLRLGQQMGRKPGIIASLTGLARLAYQTGNPRRAARLVGAVQSLMTTIQSKLDLEVRLLYEHTLAAAQAALGEAAFNAAWEAGQKMTLEQAAAYALDETREEQDAT